MMEADPIERLIIPPAAAQRIVAQAGQAYLRDCVCRVREQACPPEAWEVCLLFEHASAEQLREARPITSDLPRTCLIPVIPSSSDSMRCEAEAIGGPGAAP